MGYGEWRKGEWKDTTRIKVEGKSERLKKKYKR